MPRLFKVTNSGYPAPVVIGSKFFFRIFLASKSTKDHSFQPNNLEIFRCSGNKMPNRVSLRDGHREKKKQPKLKILGDYC